MTEAQEMAAFVTARLDEWEAIACSAGADEGERTWSRGTCLNAATGEQEPVGHLRDASGEVVVYDEGAPGDGEFEHIALHDPETTLRLVASLRAILAEYAPIAHAPEYFGWAEPLAFVVRQLAAIFSTHPDYQERWKP